ncbi:MAG: TonB-dependent receptor [bacterium]|nr:MAG: TonB-dependent receptor [bacterium]
MFKRQIVFIIFLLIFPFYLSAQRAEIIVNAHNQPLNSVLIGLRDKYALRFSFDDNLLSKYKVTLTKSFATAGKAVSSLLKPFPLIYNLQGDVFVIWKRGKAAGRNEKYFLKGYIKDSKTGEPLAYSHILSDVKNTTSDVDGYFSEIVSHDTVSHLIISHLGYYILDTLLRPGRVHTILLTPSSVRLQEVKITGKAIDYVSQIGQTPGIIRLNSKVATHLPGYGDNSVFNLLRLQPGILASGEQTNSMIIWGSYAGQSKVMFDGFTVYGLRNFNDNISSFNPLMAKDIEVMKGGYDARYGGRVGGIVNISGITGNPKKVSFVFNMNNMTLNALLEIPFKNRSALVMAFRHTYFNLYNPTDYTAHRTDTANRRIPISIHVVPDYVFRDMNIKYSGIAGKNDRYFLSLYGSNDIFDYNINQPVQFRKILKNTQEENRQTGGSIFYGKSWKKGGSSNFSASFSALQKRFSDNYRIEKTWNRDVKTLDKTNSTNKLSEVTVKAENRFPVSTYQAFEFGGGLISNSSFLEVDTFNVAMSNLNVSSSRLFAYFQDVISVGKQITLKVGGRMTYALNLHKFYPGPRFSAIYKPSAQWTFSLAWGLYNQYVSETSMVDDQGNYRYLWAVSDNKDIPVLRAMHNVAGISFAQKGYLISLEGYYKTVSGLSRFVRYKNIVVPGIYHGKGRSYGLDLMIKKDYRGSTFWVAYSLSRTEEMFDYYPGRLRKYRRAPQDQRHEVKVGVMVNLHPIYLSANYVYGSGFPITYNQNQHIGKDYPYSRLDVAASWKFLNRKLKGETGISVLNVLNTQNIKFSNFEKIPLNQTSSINIYSDAIPFTPTLYLKFSF